MTDPKQKTERRVIRTAVRLLTFRITREELLSLNHRHLLFGLFCTWVIGIGRYWDDPRASLLQHLGIGSVIYIFALALLLWLVIWPLRPQAWSYFNVLAFVSLVSPPAILYAIPVERLSRLETARALNTWFLAIVAAWRVALLIFYLRRHAQLKPFPITVAALLPLTLIVTTLTVLNLERAVFDIMGGLREPGTANDTAYMVLFVLTSFSVILFIPLVVCYIGLAASAFIEARNRKQQKESSG